MKNDGEPNQIVTEATKERSHKGHLNTKQLAAIPYLVGGRSMEDGRKKAKVSKATLYAWLKQEDFRAALGEARKNVTQESLQKLKSGITEAVDTLLILMHDKQKWIRLRACEKVIDVFMKNKEIEEIEGRIASVERVIFEKRTFYVDE